MLESLRIKNFQKHDSFLIKFDPHITTIVGPNDVGKSAILRALKWALTNKPRGDTFKKRDADKMSVSIKIDGHKLIRSRGKRNLYYLNGERFEAFGNDVPEEISRVLNVSPINFQGQHDPSGFWFSLSPSEVSRRLNAIVDLSDVDRCFKYLSLETSRTRAEEKVSNKRINELKEQRKKLKDIRKIDKHLRSVEEKEKIWKDAKNATQKLSKILTEAHTRWEDQEARLSLLEALQGTIAIGEEWRGLKEKQDALEALLKQAQDALIASTTDVPDLSKVQRRASRLDQIRSKLEGLEDLITQAEELNSKSERLKTRLWRAETEFHKEIGYECPLCGSTAIPTPF